jgi:hypothetical protein
MDYDAEFAAIREESNALAQDTRRLSWALSRTVSTTIDRTAKARMQELSDSNEAIRRLPHGERERIRHEIFDEENAARQRAASVARHRVEPRVAALDKRLQNYIKQRRADTELNFPKALYGFNGPAMVALAQYREMRRGTIERATPAELLQIAQSALRSENAVGLVDFGLVEARVSRGSLSKTEDDLPAVKELVQFIEAIVDLRVEPYTLLGVVRDNIDEARKVVGRADLAQVLPIDAEHNPKAKEAFERATAEFEAEAQAAQ